MKIGLVACFATQLAHAIIAPEHGFALLLGETPDRVFQFQIRDGVDYPLAQILVPKSEVLNTIGASCIGVRCEQGLRSTDYPD